MKQLMFILALVILFVSQNFPITAQADLGEGKVLDRIVAIVGNDIIMKSDIDGKIAILKQQNPEINIEDPTLRKKVLDNAINEFLVISKAIEDSVIVTEDEVSAEWDRLKEDLIQYYGSIKRIEDVYGMSITRLQYDYRDIAKKQLLGQKLQQKKFGNIKITPREVEEFYNQFKDSLPKIPSQIELYHIVKFVAASKNAKEQVYELAKKVRDSIITGGLFSELAQRYSQDAGTASEGGELGWSAKGKLLPEFEKAAFELAPGKTSMPVETPFGYHIIQLLDKNKDSVLTRHILFRIGQSEADKTAAIDYLNSLKDSVKNGSDFIELAKIYSDESESKGFGGSLGNIPEDQIPISYKEQIINLPVGGISEPLPYNADPAKPSFHIMFKKKIIPEHLPSLQEDFKILEQKAKVFKQMKLYEDWIQQLRKELYWEIKDND